METKGTLAANHSFETVVEIQPHFPLLERMGLNIKKERLELVVVGPHGKVERVELHHASLNQKLSPSPGKLNARGGFVFHGFAA